MTEQIARETVLDAVLASPLTVGRIEARRITIGPGVALGAHTHNGPVVGTIVSGSAIVQIDGGEMRELGPGEVFYEPQGVRIDHFDGGPQGVVFLGFFPVPPGVDPVLEFVD